MVIRAKDYIETAFSAEDAEQINQVIDKAVSEYDKVVIDFEEISFFTTLFFSSAVTRFIKDIGPDAYTRKFEITGLTKVGQIAYQHSLEFAVEAINMTPEEKQAKLFAIDSILDGE